MFTHSGSIVCGCNLNEFFVSSPSADFALRDALGCVRSVFDFFFRRFKNWFGAGGCGRPKTDVWWCLLF